MPSERRLTAEKNNHNIMPCFSRFQPSFSSGTMRAVGRWEGLVVCNSNLIWPLWSTTLVHILWLWWFWGACENLPPHFRSFLALIFTNYLAFIFYRLRGIIKGHMEVRENGQTSEGIELWPAAECASLFGLWYVSWGCQFQVTENIR